MAIKFGIVVVSDTAFKNPASDRALTEFKKLISEFESIIVPDEVEDIKKCLYAWCDNPEKAVNVIITTGGTGFTPRDVTPEATKQVLHKLAPGLQQALMAHSLQKTPMAMLSRGICGIRNSTLIVNFPGSPKAISECWECLQKVLPHAVDQMSGRDTAVRDVHKAMQQQPPTAGSRGVGCSCSHGVEGPAASLERTAKDLDPSAPVCERPRHSPYPILSVSVAVDLVLRECESVTEQELVAWDQALGRILAKDVVALEAVPPFPASIKDGYAILAQDGAGLRQVVGSHTAGDAAGARVGPGTCCRISTGAPLPPGADSVVQVEDTDLVQRSAAGEELQVNIRVAPTVGQDVRPVGSDMEQGQLVLNAGTVLGASELGVLAASGCLAAQRGVIQCRRKPVIGVLSTGNELLDACLPQAADNAKIRDCNRVALLSLLRSWGFQAVDLGIALDSVDSLKSKLADALQNCQVILTTGGVSMGEKDLLKPVLQEHFHGSIHFGRIFMKPGKPTTFATVPNSTVSTKKSLIFALPGNPVSALVTCYLFVRPALKKLSGLDDVLAPVMRVKLCQEVTLDPRPEYQRCVLKYPPVELSHDSGLLVQHRVDDVVPVAIPTGNQISSRILSMHGAQVLAMLPPASKERKALPAGTIVPAIIMD